MSSDLAVCATNLGKCYTIFDRPEHRLKQMLALGRRRYYREFWAIKDVSLEIYRGETVGIVGCNGSGKSTLLQLICGTLMPTSGHLTVNGRVAALLELGAGFNPEFTGRENVYMNGSILGLTQQEIRQRFDSIATFADIGQFLDQPVKTYSSGMYARLAFSVAINVDPDILIIDEALAVGDEAFQRKCFSRLNEFKGKGRTVVFVSHATNTVVELCDRALLMDGGEQIYIGRPKRVVNLYHRLIYSPPAKRADVRTEIKGIAPDFELSFAEKLDNTSECIGEQDRESGVADYQEGLLPSSSVEYLSQGVTIDNVRMEDEAGQKVNVLVAGQIYSYCYTAKFTKNAERVRFGMIFKSITGVEIGGQVSHEQGNGIREVLAGTTLDVCFRFENRLLPGTYFSNSGVLGHTDDGETYLHRVLDAYLFRVKPTTRQGIQPTGLVDLRPQGDGTTVRLDFLTKPVATMENQRGGE